MSEKNLKNLCEVLWFRVITYIEGDTFSPAAKTGLLMKEYIEKWTQMNRLPQP